MNPFIIPIFLPQMGCSYRCLYCNQKTITRSPNSPLDWDTLYPIVEAGLSSRRKKPGQVVEIAFFGGTFTNLPLAFQERLLTWAGRYWSEQRITSIRISTRPEALSEKNIEPLLALGVRTIELGIQSLDDEVLALSNRGHTARDAFQTMALLKRYPIQIGIQLMAGLPGDTAGGFLKTVRQTVALKPDFVRLYPTLVFRDTPLAQWWRQKRYRPLSLPEAVSLCGQALELYEENGIEVIRIGLQENEGIRLGRDLIAGPHHPAFGSLVRGECFTKKILQRLSSRKSLPSRLGLEIGPQDLSYLTGNKRKNLVRLMKESGIDLIDLKSDPKLPSGSWRWV
jgi:histone acetyltransferase (RNA polymerase elongator complex component)